MKSFRREVLHLKYLGLNISNQRFQHRANKNSTPVLNTNRQVIASAKIVDSWFIINL